jgi:hypothetical protein
MKPGTDEFESLRRLLAWKRHEQPPPGYFNDFPHRIVSRIEWEQDSQPKVDWRAWLGGFDPRPILVGAYTVGVCGLLLAGIGLSQALVENPLDAKVSQNPLNNHGLAAAMAPAYPLSLAAMPASDTLPDTANADLLSSPPPFLFDAPQFRPQPASVNFKLDIR